MPDREKVIKAVESCFDDWLDRHSNFYPAQLDYVRQIKADAIAMFKEQETEWEHLWDAPDGTYKGRCKKCGFVHYFIESHDAQYNFCPSCGRSVKGNDKSRVSCNA